MSLTQQVRQQQATAHDLFSGSLDGLYDELIGELEILEGRGSDEGDDLADVRITLSDLGLALADISQNGPAMSWERALDLAREDLDLTLERATLLRAATDVE